MQMLEFIEELAKKICEIELCVSNLRGNVRSPPRMNMLTQHFRRDQRHTSFRDGIACSILDWIDTSELADAVIEALGLREEREDVASFQPGEIDDSMMPPRQKGRLTWTPSHRYVTEWQPDA